MQKNYSFNDLAALMIALTAALDANTNAILGKKSENPQSKAETTETTEAAETTEASETTEAAEDAETKQAESSDITIDDVEAVALRVKAKHGVEEVRKIVKSLTGTTSIKKIEESDYAAVIEALGAKESEPVSSGDDNAETQSGEADEEKTATVDYAEKRNEMDKLIADLASSEAGFGRAENFEKAKHLIKTVGGAPKKAEIPDENLEAMIAALNEALAQVSEAEAAKNAEDDDL